MRMRMRMRMRKKNQDQKTNSCFEHKTYFYCIKMESQKTINLFEKTSDNKDLLKKKSIRKKITAITKKLR